MHQQSLFVYLGVSLFGKGILRLFACLCITLLQISISHGPFNYNMFTESIRQGSLPSSLSQATIFLLLKKDKHPTLYGLYRPRCLLCNEHKILAKVFAGRMETVLPFIISEDQTDFIKGRHSFPNIQRLLNIVLTSNTSQKSLLPQ